MQGAERVLVEEIGPARALAYLLRDVPWGKVLGDVVLLTMAAITCSILTR